MAPGVRVRVRVRVNVKVRVRAPRYPWFPCLASSVVVASRFWYLPKDRREHREDQRCERNKLLRKRGRTPSEGAGANNHDSTFLTAPPKKQKRGAEKKKKNTPEHRAVG